MAYDYNKMKQAYQGLSREQQQQFVDKYKDNDNFKQFQSDYLNEINGKSTTKSTTPTTTPQVDNNNANSKNQNGTNGGNSIQETANNINNEVNAGAEQIKKQQEVINKNQKLLEQEQNQFDPNEASQQGDNSETPATTQDNQGVKQEGALKPLSQEYYNQSGDEDQKKIINNLNEYLQTTPYLFNSYEEFKNNFSYNARNDAQKQTLDSWWNGYKKNKDLKDSTVKYGTGESIAQGMNESDITEDQLNYIRENNEEAYRKWQSIQEENVLKIISNYTVPDVNEFIGKLDEYINNLDLGSNRYDFMAYNEELKSQYQIDSKLSALESTISKMQADKSSYDAIISKYSNAGADTMGGAAANYARMQRALAPYQQSFSMNAQIYSSQLQSYQMSAAQVKSDLNVMYQQTQEDQRVFNNKLSALGFAMQVDSYRTPEQQAALQLKTQYEQGQISLLQQSQLNDLSLYNQYATSKMQNQLNSELTDLSVTDPNQLRANLNNVLTEYYNQYGDIIKRSKSEVIDDVLAYAEKNGVSVAEALRKDFIEKLQNKDEYKQKVKDSYGMNVSQQISNGMLITKNPDGTITRTKIDDTAIPGTNQKENINAFKDTWNNTQDWNSYVSSILQNITTGTWGGQCGAAMNDILQGAGYGRVFGNKLSEKISVCQNKYLNSDADYSTIKAGDFAVIDTGATYTDSNGNKVQAGHVGLITGYDGDYVYVLDSNGQAGKNNRGQSKYKISDLRGTYSVQGGNTNTSNNSNNSSNYNSNEPYNGISGKTSTGTDINAGGWISSLENQYKQEKWQSNDERNSTLSAYGLTIEEYNQQKQRYLEYEYKNNVIKDAEEMYKTILDLEDRESKYSDLRFGSWDTDAYKEYRETGVMPHYILGDNDKILDGVKTLDKITGTNLLNKFTEIKQAGASFGAMSDSEWNVIKGATPILDWQLSKSEFTKKINELKDAYGKILTTNGVSLPTGSSEVKTTSVKNLTGTGYSSFNNTGTNYRQVANDLLD